MVMLDVVARLLAYYNSPFNPLKSTPTFILDVFSPPNFGGRVLSAVCMYMLAAALLKACQIWWTAQNVVAVLTSDTPDVLSHAAVRARNGGVLLASCFQPDRLAVLSRLEGSFVKLSHSQVQPVPPKCKGEFDLLAVLSPLEGSFVKLSHSQVQPVPPKCKGEFDFQQV
jgi:hypothetical protein